MVGKNLPQFMKEASMPYSAESLCNVKKDSKAYSFVFKRFFNNVGDTMHVVYCRVIFLNQTDALSPYVSLQ
jgi:hypothetical protein